MDCKHKTLGGIEKPVCDKRLAEIQKLRGWLILFMEEITKQGLMFPAGTVEEISHYLRNIPSGEQPVGAIK